MSSKHKGLLHMYAFDPSESPEAWQTGFALPQQLLHVSLMFQTSTQWRPAGCFSSEP
jgi:hypothetical protein